MIESSAEERVRAARRMLARLSADTSDPRWSSRMLEQLIDTAMQAPGGTAGDVLQALFELSAQDGGTLTKQRANLIHDVVGHALPRLRDSAVAADVGWMPTPAASELTAAQAYLLLCALPEAELQRQRGAIVAALRDGPFLAEALRELGDPDAGR
jgi:hypothetical protein